MIRREYLRLASPHEVGNCPSAMVHLATLHRRVGVLAADVTLEHALRRVLGETTQNGIDHIH